MALLEGGRREKAIRYIYIWISMDTITIDELDLLTVISADMWFS